MVILSNFAENLLELMQEHNINAPALGKILKTDRTNITRYLRGERLPHYKGFVAIVEYFNVSADVLLGRKEYCEVKDFHSVQPFGQILRRVMQETQTTQYRLEKDLRISGATVYHWLTNKRLPVIEKLDKLADYLEVSVDYLLGRII